MARVAPLDEIPGEPGGMSYADFYATIRPLFWAEPFRPYVVELRNGDKLAVASPGRLTLAGRFGLFISDAPARIVRFSYDQVTRVYAADPVPVGGA